MVVRGAFDADTWPDAASITYPPSANWDTAFHAPGPTAIRAYYARSDFWQSSATPKGPAAAPSGNGSVKATMVVNHGLCSQLVHYSSILPIIPTQFLSGIEQQLADDLPIAESPKETTNLNSSDVVSFVRMADDQDSDPQGGFFFGFDADFSNIGDVPILGAAQAHANYWNPYVFRLLDGRLTVDPLRVDSSAGVEVNVTDALDPYLAAAFEEGLDGALLESLATPPTLSETPSTLAGVVWQQSDQMQDFPGDPGWWNGPAPTCTQDPQLGSKIRVVPDPTQPNATSCAELFSQMHTHLADSLKANHFGSYVGVPASALTQLWNDTALASTDGVTYDNFRCAPLGSTNQCQFVLPAERINVFPDGVELVFVDGDKEYTNPSFVVWLVLGDDSAQVSGAPILQQMCDPPRALTASQNSATTFLPLRRAFQHATTDNKLFTATGCTWNGAKHSTCGVTVQ